MKYNIYRLSRQVNPLESSHTFRSAPMSSSIMRSILHQPQAQGKQRKTRNCFKTALLVSSRPGWLTRIWVTRDVYLRWCCLCRAVIGRGWNCVRLLSCCFVFALFVVLLAFVFWVDPRHLIAFSPKFQLWWEHFKSLSQSGSPVSVRRLWQGPCSRAWLFDTERGLLWLVCDRVKGRHASWIRVCQDCCSAKIVINIYTNHKRYQCYPFGGHKNRLMFMRVIWKARQSSI